MEQDNVFDSILNRYKFQLALGTVGFVLLIGGMISSGIFSHLFVKSTKYPKESIVNNLEETIKVDVSGAVNDPGVYSLRSSDRVEDALKAAGGLSTDADLEFLTKNINLAQKLSDGVKIYIPYKGEIKSADSVILGVTGGSVQGQGSIVNINNATSDDLESLPGVGPVTAQKIINNRPYNSIEELFTKKIVTKATYEKIKDKVSVY